MLLHEFLSSAASQSPDSVALAGSDHRYTYRAAQVEADRWATLLQTRGLSSGDRIGFWLPKSPRIVPVMIGALRLGAVCVPLDVFAPTAYLDAILKNCTPRILILDQHLPCVYQGKLMSPNDLPPSDTDLAGNPVEECNRSLDVFPNVEIGQDSYNRFGGVTCDVDRAAFILHTTGTTGEPKGVVLSHRNVVAFARWTSRRIGLSATDRILNIAPLHFDLALFDLFGAAACHATCHVGESDLVTRPHDVAGIIHTEEITVVYLTPSVLMYMQQAGALRRDMLRSLRCVMYAGEPFPIGALRRAMNELPDVQFFNLFGPTETNASLCHALPGLPPDRATEVPIGEPTCGNSVELRGDDGALVRPGQIGEIVVSGPTVMRGYWTHGRFEPAQQPYRTGDLAVMYDGQFYFRGRRDRMVKVRGQRVELDAIEAVLTRLECVSEAVACVDGNDLVVLVRLRSQETSVLQIRAYCRRHLSRSHVPHHIRFVDELPRHSNGKLDRIAIQFMAKAEME